MRKLDDILSGTNNTRPENGKITSKADSESEQDIPARALCFDPENPDAPCPICGGKGLFIFDVAVDDPRFGKFQRCPNNPIENDREMQARLRRYGNLSAYRDKQFDNFQTELFASSYTQNVVDSLKTAKQAAQTFAESPSGWIVYEGPYGCGKTHLAVAIANYRLKRYGEQALFITAPDLLDYLRGTFGNDSQDSYDDTFERIRNAPLLVLDDLGTENPSLWAREKLFQLLNHRHAAELPTVITTNARIDDLDERLVSRMMQRSVVKYVKINAPDYRRGTRAGDDGKSFTNMRLYQHMRFETFSAESDSPDDAANLKRGLTVAVEWAANPQGWLYIIGEYGAGKTHLAAAIAYDLHERGHDVMFTTVPDLLDYLRVTFNPRSEARFDKRFHEIVNVPFLVLDDLRLASATPWAREKLFQIIDYRYLARMPTVITSSETVEETDKRLATRLLDRRLCRPFALQVRSYAYRVKKQS